MYIYIIYVAHMYIQKSQRPGSRPRPLLEKQKIKPLGYHDSKILDFFSRCKNPKNILIGNVQQSHQNTITFFTIPPVSKPPLNTFRTSYILYLNKERLQQQRARTFGCLAILIAGYLQCCHCASAINLLAPLFRPLLPRTSPLQRPDTRSSRIIKPLITLMSVDMNARNGFHYRRVESYNPKMSDRNRTFSGRII